MALNIGDALLNLLGHRDPRESLARAALLPGGTTTPGAAPGTAATTAAAGGAATPGVATPQAYQTPPDLLELYTELSDRQSRERRIDTGIGLIASSFAHPENRALIAEMMGSGESTGSSAETLRTLLQIQQAQRDAQQAALAQQERERQLAALPAIAETFGIDEHMARLLFDNGQLDDLFMQRDKPPEIDSTIWTDPTTGASLLINSDTGETIRELGGGHAPTDSLKEMMAVNAARVAQGEKPYTPEEWLEIEANLKKPQTSITTNINPQTAGAELASGLDEMFLERFKAGQSKVDAVTSVQQAQRALSGGVVAGHVLSPVELEGRKLIASAFGLPDDASANTEVLKSSLSAVVRANIKDLGTGNAISNSDREFMEKEIGSNMTLTQDAIQRLLDIQEYGGRNKIIELNAELDARADALTQIVGEDDPTVKRIRGSKYQVPELMPETKARIVERIPEGHRIKLVELAQTTGTGLPPEDAIAEFEAMYGKGSVELVLEMAGG